MSASRLSAQKFYVRVGKKCWSLGVGASGPGFTLRFKGSWCWASKGKGAGMTWRQQFHCKAQRQSLYGVCFKVWLV